jgi:uncharacterized protein with HEPN domain
MTDEVKKRLLDAQTACLRIIEVSKDLDFSGYEADWVVRSAVERQLEIIGEALNRAEDEEPNLIDDLPELRQVIGIRNRIIHGYDTVDDEIVWDVAQNKVPLLERRLFSLLEAVAN